MKRILLNVLFLISVVFSGLPAPVTLPAQAQAGPRLAAQSSQYVEDFSQNTYKSYTQDTAWNTAQHELTLEKISGSLYTEPWVTADGTGGSYVVWTDLRNNDCDGNWDIYAQHRDSRGNRLWADDLRVNSDSTRRFQRSPQAAVDSQGNLVVVWKDARDDHYLTIFAQKISPPGQKLWNGDVLVNGIPSYPVGWDTYETVSIASMGGDEMLVAWMGSWNNDWGKPHIFAQKLGVDGQRLWSQDVLVNLGGLDASQTYLSTAVGPQGSAAIAWMDNRNGGQDIYLARLDQQGNHRWAMDVKVSAGSGVNLQGDLSLYVNDLDEAVAVWRKGRGEPPIDQEINTIFAQKVSPAGALLWEGNVRVNQNITHTFRGSPHVMAAPNHNSLVVWHDNEGYYSTNQVYSQLITPSGSVAWNKDFLVSPYGWWGEWMVSLSTRGTTAYIAWIRWGDVYLQMLDIPGQKLLLPYPALVSDADGRASQAEVDMAPFAEGFIAAWVDDRRNNGDIRAQAFNNDGTPRWSNSIMLNQQDLVDHFKPQVAVNQNGLALVVWNHPDKEGIDAQLVDTNGMIQWIGDHRVNADPRKGNFATVAALQDNTFIVAWPGERAVGQAYWDIFLQRIDEAGNRLWPSDRRINTGDYIIPLGEVDTRARPAVTVDGEGNLVLAWRGDTGNGADIFMRRVSPEGVPLWSQEIALHANLDAVGTGSDAVVAVVAQSRITVVWKSNLNNVWGIFAGQYDLSGARLNGPTQVSDSTPGVFYGNPDVTLSDNGEIFITWDDEHYAGRNIYARRLNASGGLLWAAPVQLNDAGAWPVHPAGVQTANGAFLVAWNDRRHGDSSLYARAIDLAGNLTWNLDRQIFPTNAEQFYISEGVAESLRINGASEMVIEATLTAQQTLDGGLVRYFLSNTGGVTWEEVSPGVKHTFQSPGSDLRWKAVLFAGKDNLFSPRIQKIIVDYASQPVGDIYEPDDTCNQAKVIPVDGSPQEHNFFIAGDVDWVRFRAVGGQKYVIEANDVQSQADLVLEIWKDCGGEVLGTQRRDLGPNLQFIFSAPESREYWIKLENSNRAFYGQDTQYHLSVRAYFRQDPVIVMAAGHRSDNDQQDKIDAAADFAYRVFLRLKVPKTRIRYFSPSQNRDVDVNGALDDIAGPPTPENIRDAIQNWVPTHTIDPQISLPVFIYLVDHGKVDIFLANGDQPSQQISAGELDLWLKNLEAQVRVDPNIIIDTCYSGSFIDQTNDKPGSISAKNRVVITSTSSDRSAYTSWVGTLFSDAFFSALADNKNLESAFLYTRDQIQQSVQYQIPWLDDNGDASASSADGALARSRGFGQQGSEAPVIDWVQISRAPDGYIQLNVQARAVGAMQSVKAMVFSPDYRPPQPIEGTLPVLNAPVITLTRQEGNIYQGSFLPDQAGKYSLLFSALDDFGIQSPAVASGYCNQCLYLPVVGK